MITINKTVDCQLLTELNQEVQDLHQRLYPDQFKAFDQTKIEKAIKEMLGDENTHAFLAKHANEAVGYMICMHKERKESAFQYATPFLIIDQIGVKSKYRRMGIAKQLLHEATELAKQKNITEIRSEVWTKNLESEHFFQMNGFIRSKSILSKLS